MQQESGIEIVAEAEDGETAVEMVQRHVLDVVLLDVGLPGIGGVEACRQIKQQNPQLPVLVLLPSQCKITGEMRNYHESNSSLTEQAF